MHFSRDGEWIFVTRITGPTHNRLGLRLVQRSKESFNRASETVDVVISNPIGIGPVVLDPKQVKERALDGINDANRAFGSNYVALGIRFIANDSAPAEAYRTLAYRVIEYLARP